MNNSNELYYEEEGIANSELVIFIHNNLLSNWIWKNQRDFFRDYHCIYLDLPNHGNSYFDKNFSIENSGELIKNLIEEKVYNEGKIANNSEGSKNNLDNSEGSKNNLDNLESSKNNTIKSKKVHLIGVSIGGQIILYLLAKYPQLIDTAIVTGVSLYESPEKIMVDEILAMLDKLKVDILDKKSDKFLVKAILAEYGLGKEHFEDLNASTEIIINNNSLNSITKESLEFKIPKIANKKLSIDNNININNNDNTRSEENLLVLYGTKEYPKVEESTDLIKNKFKTAQIYSVYRSIHLWNLIDYEWFNEIVREFITNKTIDLNNAPYLKKKG